MTVTEDNAAETFLTEGLSKVLKINNICDSDHLTDCGIVSAYTNIMAESKVMPKKLSEFNSTFTMQQSWNSANYVNPQKDIDTKTAAFETQNGESILLVYNPYCISDPRQSSGWYYTQPLMCANFIYDLNGNKGPNTVGKDIGFISVMEPSDPVVVAPMPMVRDAGKSGQKEASALCAALSPDVRLPNKYEIASMFYNRELIGMYSNDYWSSSVISATHAWDQSFLIGGRYACGRESSHLHSVRCINR